MAKIKNIKVISTADIKAKFKDLDEKIDESITNKKNGMQRPTQVFLNEIKEQLKRAIENNVSYKDLNKIIFNVYNLSISEQTIRAFAHNVLNVPKAKRTVKNKVLLEEQKDTKNKKSELRKSTKIGDI